MQQYLNQTELLALERFNADYHTVEAVKKVILFRIYHDGIIEEGIIAKPLKNFMLNITDTLGKDYTDEELGRVTRARRIAAELLELGMKDVEKFKRIEPTKPKEVDYK